MELLSQRIKRGELSALKEIYDQYWKKLFIMAIKLLGNHEDAEEALQDTFLNFWMARDKLDENRPLEPFLLTIGKRKMIDKFRKQVQTVNIDGLKEGNMLAATTEDPFVYKELHQLAEDIIDKLPPKRKIVFNLRREQGLTNKEIADQLDISIQMVERQMKLAIKMIRENLRLKTEIFSVFIFLFLG